MMKQALCTTVALIMAAGNGAARSGGLVEAIPIAATGGIKVMTVDYVPPDRRLLRSEAGAVTFAPHTGLERG